MSVTNSVVNFDIPAQKEVESFSLGLPWLKGSDGLRLDAGFYNPRVAEALAILKRSGVKTRTLGQVTERVFIPPRFKRIYVDKQHGVPFIQGSHIVHFYPADIKYLSRAAHKRLDRWIIKAGWVLVTCSGTIGRVTIAPPSWNDWAASQHILRIIPKKDGPCPAGYISSYLMSKVGQAQLTSRIYGAVVDEITEEHAQSVLIPVPETEEQHEAVAVVNSAAMLSVAVKDKAVKLTQKALFDLSGLIPELMDESSPIEVVEDAYDAEIARKRIAEIAGHLEKLVRGEDLERRMNEWQR
jgi:type I restriction enzyme S subunit